MPYREYTHLDFDFPEPGILRIQFNNPKSLNSVNAGQHSELARIWGDIDRDPEVKVVIVTGAGEAFSSGGDFGIIEEMAGDFEGRILTMREARDIVYGVVNCSKPIVSAMTGPAVGAGLAVGLLADVSIATPSTKIVDGHTRLGVAAGDHGVLIWPLLCGMAKAKYHLMTCEPVSGEEAERIGPGLAVRSGGGAPGPGSGGGPEAGVAVAERRALDEVRPQRLAAGGRADLRRLRRLRDARFRRART